MSSKVILVNFATEDFYFSQALLNRSAVGKGVDYTVSWTPRALYSTYPGFIHECKDIFSCKRGAGYWLWKPFIIIHAVANANEGDIIIYLDSGIEIIDSLQPLLDICRQSNEGILLFDIPGCLNKMYIKRDCFVLMNCDTEKYWNASQYAAGYQIYRKNKFSWQFLSEVFSYSKNYNIISDSPNTCGLENFPSFIDHRHDQAVLSLVAEKYNISRHRAPSQDGDYFKMPKFRIPGELPTDAQYIGDLYDNSPYGTLLNLHRKRVRISN